jgi:hypothetical protein
MITFLEEQQQRERKREGGHFSILVGLYMSCIIYLLQLVIVCMKLKKVDLIKNK